MKVRKACRKMRARKALKTLLSDSGARLLLKPVGLI